MSSCSAGPRSAWTPPCTTFGLPGLIPVFSIRFSLARRNLSERITSLAFHTTKRAADVAVDDALPTTLATPGLARSQTKLANRWLEGLLRMGWNGWGSDADL